MNRLFLLILVLACVVTATRTCILREKKQEDPEVHVIHLGDYSKDDSGEPEIVTLHIPDSRRKRELENSEYGYHCKTDSDCPTKHVCIPHLACIKGYRKVPRSVDNPAPIKSP